MRMIEASRFGEVHHEVGVRDSVTRACWYGMHSDIWTRMSDGQVFV